MKENLILVELKFKRNRPSKYQEYYGNNKRLSLGDLYDLIRSGKDIIPLNFLEHHTLLDTIKKKEIGTNSIQSDLLNRVIRSGGFVSYISGLEKKLTCQSKQD